MFVFFCSIVPKLNVRNDKAAASTIKFHRPNEAIPMKIFIRIYIQRKY